MPKVYSIDGITPVVHPSAYVHPSAVLIGDVIVGALIGMNCVVNDNAEVGEDAVVEPNRKRIPGAIPLSELKKTHV